MLNIIQNTIGAIRRVGESVVKAGLKMWLPFTKAEHLGKELVVDGNFATDSEWTVSTQSDISGGEARILSTDGSYQYIAQSNSGFTKTQGKFVKITLDIVEYVSGTIKVQFSGGSNYILPQAVGTHTLHVQNDGSSGTLNIARVSGVTDITIDNVSVKLATQETPDISGNDNNAILKTGKCLTFTGNDSVQTAFPSSKDIKTIAFWIYPTHSSTDEVVFYFGDAAGGDKYIDLDHLVMESDANNNINFDVYIDGVLRGETNYGGNNPTLTINQWQRVVLTTDTAINTTNDKFYIAHRENGAFGRFNMSDLQIYGAEFTTDDIAYDYANPQKLVTDNASSNVTLNDLHAWWHMSEGDGTIAFDSAPISNGNIDGETYDGTSLGATYDDAQERIPQLGMMNWSKGSNVLTNSNDFGANPWNTQSGSVDLVSGYEAPDGTLTAWKVSRTGGAGNGILYAGITANIGVVRSIWAKTVSGTGTVHLTSHNTNLNSLFTVTNEWQRFSATSGSAVAGNFYAVDFRDTNGTLTEVILWGAQEEVNVGDSLSAFRKTDGTAVTDATLISCATDSQKDILGNAVRVKGSGFNLDGTGYAEVLDDASINPSTAITIGCWVYLNSESDKGIVAKWSSGNLDYMLYKQTSTRIKFYVGTTNLSHYITPTSGWVYIVGTYDGSNMKTYTLRNDDVDSNGNINIRTTTRTKTGAITNSSNNLEIGRYYNNSTKSYSEKIDSVILYDVALEQEEVIQNFNATKSGHNN